MPEFASRLGGWLILGQTRAGEHRGTGSHTPHRADREGADGQRCAARIAPSMPGKAKVKPESSSFDGSTR